MILKLAFLIALVLIGSTPQNGYDIFQQALVKERGQGNLHEAISLYQRILREYGENRTLAANTLVRVGHCYEKLGSVEARKMYQTILRDYPDQQEAAAEARTRLSALEQKPDRASESDLVMRRVWSGTEVDDLGSISPDGRYLTHLEAGTGNLAIREVSTGRSRALTKKAITNVEEFAQFSKFSRDGS
ncbi:MAG: tetratricopeptide repeat protein, partial [Acidobacteria bacterium]|nr:tetratricopeptide repeat protein [Acidobacteriota bacterium]